MVLLITVLAFLGLSYLIGRAILWLVGYKPNTDKFQIKNPYIIAHLGQLENDKNYDEYIKYLDENNLGGIPFDKEITYEEARMKKELGLH